MAKAPQWADFAPPAPRKPAPVTRPVKTPMQQFRDSFTQSTGEAIKNASAVSRNFLPDLKDVALGMVAPVLHPIDTAKSLYGLGAGLVSKGQRALGYQGNPQAEAVPNAIGAMYKQRYGSLPGFQQAVREHPASVLADVGTVASLPLVGAALERAPGSLGPAVRAARIATNPVDLTARTVANAGQLAQTAKIARAGGILDRSGQWTPAALQALSDATNGRVTISDLQANPGLANTLKTTMQTKGVNPAAAKEAILAFHNAPTPRSRVTGSPAPVAARQESANAVAAGKKAVADTVATRPPSPTSVGDALSEAYKDSYNGYTSKYNAVMSGPEVFEPAAGNVIKQSIANELQNAGYDDFLDYPSRRASLKAHQFLSSKLPTLMDNDEMSLSRLEATRRELNELWRGAEKSGSVEDARTVRTMIEGLDNGMETAAQNGFLRSGDPDTFVNGLRDARAAFAEHQSRFNDDPGVRAAVNRLDLQPDNNGLITAPPSPGNAEHAHNIIVNSIVNKDMVPKTGGHAAYDRWHGVLGGNGDVLDDTLRQMATQRPHGESEMALSGRDAQAFLQTPLAGELYPNPADVSRLNVAAEGHNILDAAPGAPVQSGSLASDSLGAAGRYARNVVGGHALGSLLGIPALGEVAGGVVAGALERNTGRRAIATELSGAPEFAPTARRLQDTGNAVAGVARPLGLMHVLGMSGDQSEQDQGAPVVSASDDDTSTEPSWGDFAPDDREHRASGGKVGGIEHLVERLMTRAKHAKKATTKHTEPLLNHDDSSIVAALRAAKQAI